MSHQKCSMLHFVTASFDLIGVVRTNRLSVRGNMDTPMRARRSVITWGRGEAETLSIHVESTWCAPGLILKNKFLKYSHPSFLVCKVIDDLIFFRYLYVNTVKMPE